MRILSAARLRALLLLILPAFLFVAAQACAQRSNVPSRNVTQMREAMNGNPSQRVIVLDIRTAPELNSALGRLDNIVHIPLQELQRRLSELEKHKSAEIHVICRSGNRSVAATRFLREQGFTAYNILGGMLAWRQSYGTAGK
jgi:rhodanese-related sulfurtransferase